jgi:hypothetical protein
MSRIAGLPSICDSPLIPPLTTIGSFFSSLPSSAGGSGSSSSFGSFAPHCSTTRLRSARRTS